MNNTTVVIVGLATATRDLWSIYKSQYAPDAKVWTLNRAVRDDIVSSFECDLLFEMHSEEDLRMWARSIGSHHLTHYEWLQEKQEFPIIAIDKCDRIPNSIRYPKDEVLEDLFENFRTDSEMNVYMTSTLSYMIGYAIYKQVKRIVVLGFEMKTETEYVYQRDGAALLLGVAAGRGIEVIIPDESDFLKSKMYGYEGAQMITRQSLEIDKQKYMQSLQNAIGDVNRLNTIFDEAKKNGTEEGELLSLAEKVNKKISYCQRLQGALSYSEKLIAECDLQEKDITDIPDKMMIVAADD